MVGSILLLLILGYIILTCEPIPVADVELNNETVTTAATTVDVVVESDPIFLLSDYERYIVECVVMGEARGESYEGKVLVAQCILNACLIDGLQPSEVRKQFKYAGWNENPSEEVKQAVSAVFDDGYKVTEEPILYFYAPSLCKSSWHETQRYILTEGCHRFFARW